MANLFCLAPVCSSLADYIEQITENRTESSLTEERKNPGKPHIETSKGRSYLPSVAASNMCSKKSGELRTRGDGKGTRIACAAEGEGNFFEVTERDLTGLRFELLV